MKSILLVTYMILTASAGRAQVDRVATFSRLSALGDSLFCLEFTIPEIDILAIRREQIKQCSAEQGKLKSINETIEQQGQRKDQQIENLTRNYTIAATQLAEAQEHSRSYENINKGLIRDKKDCGDKLAKSEKKVRRNRTLAGIFGGIIAAEVIGFVVANQFK